ncbi:aminotransferase class V-fold PLP-dependent enzyme [Corynebacterium sp. zg-331]|uniref:aminotransferase class V-fold PLP-dependent enzyme n=1 Tax=unclassified Corynebacterium TaxID=2624378 RepID=UPI00128C582D|nr:MULTISPECIES: aminotransferase class V-fold PLP-dependent enzyme [unclassified Corynebacterium]MBC3186624.1 aminotransferase class V-fold PLP-dependent enzyme [Corynebacterium sp. zg-331]MPV53108.1 aminotransferase class V-fold PLP-dependent enzyme [Corynebacterium sp. zg331]
MGYDVAGVRGLYSALGDGWTYLNAHEQPQIPERVIAGVARAFRTAPTPIRSDGPSRHGHAARLEGDLHVQAARVAVADLVGATPERVVLGSSLEVLYRNLLTCMKPMLRHGSSAVVSRLDRPELSQALVDAIPDVRWAEPDLATGELPAYQYTELVDRSTRLATIPAAHDLVGVVTPVKEIVDAAHQLARLWVLVDASAYAPYRLLDAGEWDADIIALDLAALGGPQLGALIFRDERMIRRLERPERLEDPISAGLAGGVPALVDHLASLATGARGSRRERLRYSMDHLDYYLSDLGRDLVFFLGSLPSVHIVGVSGEAAAEAHVDRVPRISFAVRDVPARAVYQRLLDNDLYTTMTPHTPLLEAMGIEEIGGAVTVSLAPFSQGHDVDHLTRVVASLG